MEQDSFGNWLKRRRKSLDLTQAELGDQVGCSAAAIRKIEAEERRPSAQIVERLAEIFEIPRSERAAFLRFARGEVRSAPATTKEDFPWQASITLPRSNLPATVTSLIGREKALDEVHAFLLKPEIRLITLIGPPGIGKTRLSIEAARASLPDFPDGVFFVALAPLEASALLALTVAQALSFIERTPQLATEQLTDAIRDKQMLVVLDNCEHLIDDAAALASELLSACPRLKILVTSRESLRIAGEWIYTIPALHVPKEGSSVAIGTVAEFPALALFSERARSVRPDFALNTENIRTVSSICAQLDGLPLAIELMAARMRVMSPQSLLEHLNNEFVLSADGMRAASPRQKTLNDAIAWSYNLLSKEEQRLFTYLSVFSGGFTVELVEHIFSEIFASQSVAILITSLLDKSLIQRSINFPDEPRFDMLVTIQQFALNRLQSLGLEEDARNRHLAYFHHLAEQADKEIRGPKQVEWLHRLSVLRDDLRAALAWAIEGRQTKVALQLANNLSLFWFRRSDLSEGRQWLRQVIVLPDTQQYPTLYSYTLAQLAFHSWLQIGPKEARPFVAEALDTARANNDRWNTAWALMVLGLVLTAEKNFRVAQSTLEESKVLFQVVNDEWGYANTVISLGLVAYDQGDRSTALALHEEAVSVFRKLGDRYFESVALRFIGTLRIMESDLRRGTTVLQDALIIAQQLESKFEIAACLSQIGDAELAGGNYLHAVQLYVAARNIFDSIGVWQQEDEAKFENELARCRTQLSEPEFAAAMAEGHTVTMERAIDYALSINS